MKEPKNVFEMLAERIKDEINWRLWAERHDQDLTKSFRLYRDTIAICFRNRLRLQRY